MRKRQDRAAIGVMWAAIGLPFLFGAVVAQGQTTGLPSPMNGDCVTGATGAVVCGKTNGTTFAPSATVDATNAANITSGTLPLAQVPVLSGAKLPGGPAGTLPAFNAAGVQMPGVAAPYTATAGPVKVAPYNVSAPASATGLTAGGPYGTTSFRMVNLANGTRLITSGNVTGARFFLNDKNNLTSIQIEVWRVNASGTFSLVGRSADVSAQMTAGTATTVTLAAPIAAKAGDYVGMLATGTWTGQGTNFPTSPAYPTAAYPTYYANNAPVTGTQDFTGGTTGATYGATANFPIEVYMAQGPVVACGIDSKMQGIPFSGNFLQANYNGTFNFPVAFTSSLSTAFPGAQVIDPANQPCAYIGRTLGYTTANLAVTGITTTQWMTSVLPTMLALKPAVAVLSGTINDSAFSIPASTTLSNFQSMYSQLIAGGTQRVVITGAEPANYGSAALWTVMESANSQIKSWCQAQAACVWVGDRVQTTLGQYRSDGPAGNYRNMQPNFIGDAPMNLHFNNAGAQLMGLIEAEGIEPPTALGATVAVTQPTGGTRVRQVQAIGPDGTLGWKWQDSRDYLQMDPQIEAGAPLSAGSGNPGQQTVGCVVFNVARGYVRCDGNLRWDLAGQTLYATAVNTAVTNSGYMVVKSAVSAGGPSQGVLDYASAARVIAYGPNATTCAPVQLVSASSTVSVVGVYTFGCTAAAIPAPLTVNGTVVGSNLQAGEISITSSTVALPVTSQAVTVTLAANYAPTWAAPAGSLPVALRVCQNGTGGFTFTPAANMKGFTGISAAAGACTRFQAQYFPSTATWEAVTPGVTF